MFDNIRAYLQYQFHHPNYFYFMVSLILMIIVPPFSTVFEIGSILLNITFGGVLLMAVFYTTSNYRQFYLHSLLGIVLFGMFILYRRDKVFLFINPILMFIFFSFVFRNIVYYIFHVKRIGLNEVFASIAGYLVLGIMATPFFFLLEQSLPNSFHLPEGPEFYDFFYFSYITLTSVGFGDIAPIHPVAQSFTIIVGVFGQLYLTILVAIIIGKYLAYDIEEKEKALFEAEKKKLEKE